MANTHGFDVVAEITQQGILDILQGAWVSSVLKKNIPALPSSVGGISIKGGQVQLSVADVTMVQPGAGSVSPAGALRVKFKISVGQVQILAPPLPLLSIVTFEAEAVSLIPVGSKGGQQDVALLFDQIPPANSADVTLIPADPVQANLKTYVTEFVHQEFRNGDFPSTVKASQNLTAYTCDATADLLDDPNDLAHQVQVVFPFMVGSTPQIRLIVPIHVRIDNIQKTVSLAPDLVPMMGIETQLIITTTDLVLDPGLISADLSLATVEVGTIAPAGSDYPGEGANFTANAGIINAFLGAGGLQGMIKSNLKTQGEAMLKKLPSNLRPFVFEYPKPSELKALLAQQIHDSMVGIGPQEIFPGPSTLPGPVTPTFVVPLVLSDALAICIHTKPTGGMSPAGMTNFVRPGDIFSIAISAEKTMDMINAAKVEQFPSLPVVVNVGDRQVRLKSLNPSLTSAIHFSGDLTAINVILGKWDVDASFDEDVGLEWLPPDPSKSNTQSLKANTSEPDVHLSGLAWLITILSGFITGGIAGAIIGAVIVGIVEKIASDMGTVAVKDSVTKAISSVGAWPSPISAFQLSVNSAFKKEIEISGEGLTFGG